VHLVVGRFVLAAQPVALGLGPLKRRAYALHLPRDGGAQCGDRGVEPGDFAFLAVASSTAVDAGHLFVVPDERLVGDRVEGAVSALDGGPGRLTAAGGHRDVDAKVSFETSEEVAVADATRPFRQHRIGPSSDAVGQGGRQVERVMGGDLFDERAGRRRRARVEVRHPCGQQEAISQADQIT